MRYRLGLDLGVSSIGSAVVELDECNKAVKICDAGARIFEVSEGAEARRLQRTARTNTVRTKKRLELLGRALYEAGLWNCCPQGKIAAGTKQLRKQCVYYLRDAAVRKKLESSHQLGRILMHLAKHRGADFISAEQELKEKSQKEGKEVRDNPDNPYKVLPQRLKEKGLQTLGQYFFERLKNKKIVRQRKQAQEVDYAIPRYLVREEFRQIWACQAPHFAPLQDESLRQKIYDILFFEHPPMPYATGNCIFISEEERLPKAHPLAERHRICEAAHNIRIRRWGTKKSSLELWDEPALTFETKKSSLEKSLLEIKQINIVIETLLMKGQKATPTKIQEALGLDKSSKIVLADKKGIEPYLYANEKFQGMKLCEGDLEELVDFIANPVNPEDVQRRLYTEEQLLQNLKRRLCLENTEEAAEVLHLFPKGRGNLGKTATKAVLKGFACAEQATTQRAITDQLAKEDPRYRAADLAARDQQAQWEALPYYGQILTRDTQPVAQWSAERNSSLNPEEQKYGKLANPAVHMMLNQLRLVVNDIVRIYGRPQAIHVEVGRDVGRSKNKRKEIEKQQKKNREINDEARKYLVERNMVVNGTNILKYKLAKEQKWKDAFDSTKNIPQSFEGFEIEHLIPQARGGSDTPANLCLISRNDNRDKGDSYPYPYLQKSRSPEKLKAILEAAESLPENKAWRFEADAQEIFESDGDMDGTSRYLTDTRYMAKLALRYLRAILAPQRIAAQELGRATSPADASKSGDHSVRIVPIRGQCTAKLRRIWNLLGLEYQLMGFHIPRYLKLPVTDEKIRQKLPENTVNEVHWIKRDTEEVSYHPVDEKGWYKKDLVCNPEWLDKPRMDHRHHALDAIVVALSTRSLIQKITRADKIGRKLPKRELCPLTSCYASGADFVEQVVAVLDEVKVSHKAEHSPQGQLHKETGRIVLGYIAQTKAQEKQYGQFFQKKEEEPAAGDPLTVYKRKVEELIKTQADLRKDVGQFCKFPPEWHERIAKARQDLADAQQGIAANWDRAREQLEQEREEQKAEGKKVKEIGENHIMAKAIALAQHNRADGAKPIAHKIDYFECNKSLITVPKHGLYYQSGNNHRADIVLDIKGDSIIEVIRRFDANDKNFVTQWRQKGLQLQYSLHQGDLLELNTPEEYRSLVSAERCLVVVCKLTVKDNAIGFCLAHDGRNSVLAKKQKYLAPALLVKGGSFFREHGARKVELSPFGKMKRKHKVFCHADTKKEQV